MASFVLDSNTVLTIGGNAITCATEITIDEVHDVYWAECDGTPVLKEYAKATGSLTVELSKDSNTQVGYLDPGPQSTQALVLQPAGSTATYQDIDATHIEFSARSPRYSRTGVATMVCPFVLTGLAYAAIA